MDSETPHRMDLALLNSQSTLTSPTSPKRMEVVVHTTHEQYYTAHEQYPTTLTDQDVHNNRPERLCDSLDLYGDVESSV